MFFSRIYDPTLAQASYLIGCQQTGTAVVVDPNRDVEQYVIAAQAEGLRITHVTETHIHADFVSGARELAARTGAQLLLSDEGGADWKYAYAGDADARLLTDGDTFMVGRIRMEALHTPGHTPEHLSFLVTDTAAAAGPWGILTGDFVFVGDVGRPDLLERAAGYVGTMEAGARTLFHSLDRFRRLPDHLQVWPGHGAGSACGKALGAIASSTVGYERVANWGVAATDEEEFVRMVLDGQPEAPRYFAEMKRINKTGPRILGGFRAPNRLPPQALGGLLRLGELVVDTRSAADFAAGHIPGTINIPLDTSFTTWAGWLVPYDREIYLLLDDASARGAAPAIRALATIGLDRVAGAFDGSAIEAWTAAGGELGTVEHATITDVRTMMAHGDATIIDVRGHTEWEAGHLPGVPNVPLGYLRDEVAKLPPARPVVVLCQAGARSSIAASVLLAGGVKNVVNMTGGYTAWQEAGLPVVRAGAGGPDPTVLPTGPAVMQTS